jgi:hypothetical protein
LAIEQFDVSSRHSCLAIALFLVSASCGGSTTAPAAATAAFHGEVTDAVGDALRDARVPIVPDLVRATADVVAGNLTFVVQLATGTLDRQSTRISVLLDTDQDGATGIRQQNGIGADYALELVAASSQATVTKADPVACAAHLSCFNAVGTAPLTFSTDGMQATISLSLLGNDDGRISFQLSSYVFFQPPLSSVVFDFMPENNAPPGRVQ